jgi:hypothetical protein
VLSVRVAWCFVLCCACYVVLLRVVCCMFVLCAMCCCLMLVWWFILQGLPDGLSCDSVRFAQVCMHDHRITHATRNTPHAKHATHTHKHHAMRYPCMTTTTWHTRAPLACNKRRGPKNVWMGYAWIDYWGTLLRACKV